MSLLNSLIMTDKKLAAQRANALRSTGPRSEAGTSHSRWNALRHGGWAGGRAWSDDALRTLGEDPEDFLHLRQSLQAAWGPGEDRLWDTLIEDLARLYWRRERLEHAWQVLVLMQSTVSPYREALASVSNDGLPLLKQIEALDRAVDRKVRLLLRLREAQDRRQTRNGSATDRCAGAIPGHLPVSGAELNPPANASSEDPAENKKPEERSHDVVEKKESDVRSRESEGEPEQPPATPQKASAGVAGRSPEAEGTA